MAVITRKIRICPEHGASTSTLYERGRHRCIVCGADTPEEEFVPAAAYRGGVRALGEFIEATAGPIGRLRLEGHPDADVLHEAIKRARAELRGQ